MLERKRIIDVVESLRGRLEESSSCPTKSDRIISKCFPGVVQAYVTKAGKKDSLPRKVAKSPPFSISIATEEARIQWTDESVVRISVSEAREFAAFVLTFSPRRNQS
ncbi:hypothetical protein L484_010121 [Morus notabilis]|uniref:Uncharacterized protein n=1 Tax=Morus notabilis TaxID=981085 RepID=W9QX88_9ROSA|nr:hypothetical protein L484_010121 [Morus notabilis]